MKTMSFLFALMFLVFLGACTTGGNEPVVEPAPTVDSVSPGGLIQPPQSDALQTPTAAPPEAYPGSEAAADLEVVTGQAYPAQVDLSQMTPQPGEEAYPVEAPQPGVPDRGTAVSHQVSQDLAQRLGVDISQVSIVTVEEIEWPDGSLGCPASGMVYLTVITPGYKISLEASGQSYSYHTNTQGGYVLCGKDGQPVPN